MLKKSAETSTLNRSWNEVVFPRRVSRFQSPKPRSGLPVPSRPSVLMLTARKSPATAPGFAKRLSPVPLGGVVWPGGGGQLDPSPAEPNPLLLLQTPPWVPAPRFVPTRGIAFKGFAKNPPPKSPSVTASGGPLVARKTPETYHPPITLLAMLF